MMVGLAMLGALIIASMLQSAGRRTILIRRAQKRPAESLSKALAADSGYKYTPRKG